MYSLLLAATAATVQSPSLPAGADEEGIVVTASRGSAGIDADLFGGSATILTSDLIEHRQTRLVSDILRDVPGIAVSRVAGQTQLRLRGAEANHTLVLIDGIEVSDPFAGEFDFGTLVADDAARIEVLRGQQSALYGSDAIGGVIHYMTLGGREAPGLRARAEAGSFGTVNAAVRYAGISGDLDYAVSGTLVTTDGTPNARGGSRDLSNDGGAISTKLTWSPAANARLTGVFRYSATEGDSNDSDGDPASPTFGYIVDTPGRSFEGESYYGLVRGEVDLLDGRWTHALSGQFADTRRDGFSATGRNSGSKGERLKGSYETNLRLGTETLRHIITVAADVERETYRNTDPSGFAFSGERNTDNVGIVGQYELQIDDRAAIGASLRHDANDDFDDATTYRVQGSYRLDSGTRLRAAAGSGVKNPGFYELYGYSDGIFVGNPDLQPERSEGWEVGLEQSFDGDAFLIGATYFDSTLKNEIYTTYPAPAFVATPANRTTTSKQHGVETFATARLAEGWRLDAAYTYLKAREDGVEEVRRPKHIASLALDWRAFADRGGLNLVVRYNGDQADVAYTDPSYVPVPVRLDDFVLINLAADYRLTSNLDLFARVENLGDEDYEEVFSFVSPGRSAYAGVRVRF